MATSSLEPPSYGSGTRVRSWTWLESAGTKVSLPLTAIISLYLDRSECGGMLCSLNEDMPAAGKVARIGADTDPKGLSKATLYELFHHALRPSPKQSNTRKEKRGSAAGAADHQTGIFSP